MPKEVKEWYVYFMFNRMRLLLNEPFPVVDNLLSDIFDIVESGHPIAGPIAQRLGINLLSQNEHMPRNTIKALQLCHLHIYKIDEKQLPTQDIIKAISEIDTFRNFFSKSKNE